MRVFGYMLSYYKFRFALVVICIIGSALATLRGTLFTQSLIDDYIIPLTQSGSPDFAPLAQAILGIAAVYGAGIVFSYAYNRLMVTISQGTMEKLRTELC